MRRERGVVYVVTLAIMVGLVVLMAALAANNREDVRAIANRTGQARAELMARSAIQRAIAQIQQQTAGQTKLSDDWSKLGSSGGTEYGLGKDSYRIQITDACASVNLNGAAEPQLKRLPLTAEQVASLLDWRESGATERPDGAKTPYYQSLAQPYQAKLQPFDSVAELLLVKGFTPDALYGRSSHPANLDATDTVQYDGPLEDLLTTDSQSEDLDPNGNPKVNLQSATADQLTAVGVPSALATAIVQQQGGFSKLGDVFSVPNMTTEAARVIANYFTMGAPAIRTGLINVNTAPEAVIASLPGVSPDIAESIAQGQENGYQGLGDLLDIPGISLTVFGQVVDQLCVSSRAFRVRVAGSVGQIHVAYETTLVLGQDGQMRMTRLEPRSYGEARDRWGWPEAASSTVDAETGQ